MRQLIIAIPLMMASLLLLADGHTINFDEKADFSKFKTFFVREGKSTNELPELNNTLFLKRLGDAIRDALKEKGLKESVDAPDIVVDYRIGGSEVNSVERSPMMRVPGFGGPAVMGNQSIRYQQGLLAIDITARETNLLMWQGYYRDDEDNATQLSKKLPLDAKKLLSDYPPKN